MKRMYQIAAVVIAVYLVMGTLDYFLHLPDIVIRAAIVGLIGLIPALWIWTVIQRME